MIGTGHLLLYCMQNKAGLVHTTNKADMVAGERAVSITNLQMYYTKNRDQLENGNGECIKEPQNENSARPTQGLQIQ